ncbi:hypothetical protein ACWGPT_00385 [Pseudorhizobium sp. NPDC055634]
MSAHKSDEKDHPEQDPAEGSREVIDRELARQDSKDQKKETDKTDRESGTRDSPAPGP